MITALSVSVLYSLSALFCFTAWFKIFQDDTDLSSEEKRLSIKVLIIATILWPIVVPISCREKHSRHQQRLTQYLDKENSTAFSSEAVTSVASQDTSVTNIQDAALLIPPASQKAA